MQLIAPDILATARGLSAGATAFLLLVGLLLWAAGWRWHRFWVVFGLTLGAGIIGLTAGHASGGQQVLVVGVLLAVSVGMLALELARILAFVTGGAAAWVAAQAILPQAQELWAVFLCGGLLGVVLYRLWTMLTTSFLGVLLSAHAGLLLGEAVAKFDAGPWVAEHTAALNGGVIILTLMGILVQVWTSPAAEEKKPAEEDNDADKEKNPKKAAVVEVEPEPRSGWWWRVLPGRRAA
jgi:hypothetical protein